MHLEELFSLRSLYHQKL